MLRNRLKDEHQRALRSIRNHRYYLKQKRKERERREPVKPLEIVKKEEPMHFVGEPVKLL